MGKIECLAPWNRHPHFPAEKRPGASRARSVPFQALHRTGRTRLLARALSMKGLGWHFRPPHPLARPQRPSLSRPAHWRASRACPTAASVEGHRAASAALGGSTASEPGARRRRRPSESRATRIWQARIGLDRGPRRGGRPPRLWPAPACRPSRRRQTWRRRRRCRIRPYEVPPGDHSMTRQPSSASSRCSTSACRRR